MFEVLQLADSTNIKISFGFSSFSEFFFFFFFFFFFYWFFFGFFFFFFFLRLLGLYWVFFFFFFGYGILVPHIHSAMETWSPNNWTARGFSTGYFLKEE